jgi:hypothetical protein
MWTTVFFIISFVNVCFGFRFIIFSLLQNQKGSYLDVNGVVLPQLQVEREQTYIVSINTPNLVVCFQTLEGTPYQIGTSNCIENSATWMIPKDAPNELQYYAQSDNTMRSKLIVKDTSPLLRVWFNGKFVPNGGTVILEGVDANNLEIVITNTGTGELEFQREPIIKNLDTDNSVILSVLSPGGNTLPPDSTTSLQVLFSGPFRGFIVIVSNDIQVNYLINLMIEQNINGEGAAQTEVGMAQLGESELTEYQNQRIIKNPVNANNALILYIVVPGLSFIVVTISIAFMVYLFRRKQEVPQQLPTVKEDSDAIHITEEEESSGLESTEEVYTPAKDKFFLGST